MLIAISFLGGLAIVIGILLSYLAKRFHEDENPLVSKVFEVLPHNNCGACGFANCKEFARAVTKESSLAQGCVVGGRDTAAKVSKILGVKVKQAKKQFAQVYCVGGKNCDTRFIYQGIENCRAASLLEAHKMCTAGCMGFGDCVKVCKFDAITICDEGYPRVDFKKCVGCKACVEECPQDLIKLQPEDQKIIIRCSSHASPKEKTVFCKSACMGCGLCAKVCPQQAIVMEDNLPIIDYNKCNSCNTCVEKCPRKVIHNTEQEEVK